MGLFSSTPSTAALSGGFQIQTDDVAYLLDEKRIVRQLEVPLAMRLHSPGLPDAMHRRLRQSALGGHLADAPVRAVSRFRLLGSADQTGHPLVADRAWASGAPFVVQPADP